MTKLNIKGVSIPAGYVDKIDNEEIEVSENGVYNTTGAHTGIKSINVQVPIGTNDIVVTENGTYFPEEYNVAINNVISSVEYEPVSEDIIINNNGFFGKSDNVDVINSATVEVPADKKTKIGLDIDSFIGDITDEGILTGTSLFPSAYKMTGVSNFGDNALNSVFRANSSLKELDLSSISEVTGDKALYCAFYGCPNLESVDLSNLVRVEGNNVFQSAFANCPKITSINLDSLSEVIGTNTFSSVFSSCEGLEHLYLNGLKKIDKGSLSGLCSGCKNLQSVELKNLQEVSWGSGLQSAFQNCYKLTSVDLGKLTVINASSAFTNTFSNSSLTSTPLNNLVEIRGSSAFTSTFQNCSKLTYANLGNLKVINGSGALYSAFQSCSGLIDVNLASLEEITGTSAMNYAFAYCNSLEIINFPSLRIIENNPFTSTTFQGCSKLNEIHFRYDVEDLVSSMSAYSSKFGASSATIYFDLSRAEVQFSLSEGTISKAYIDGKEVLSPYYVSSTEDHEYVLEANIDGTKTFILGKIVDLAENEVRIVNVQPIIHTVSIDTGVANLDTFDFVVGGVTIPVTSSGYTYTIGLYSSESTTVTYRVLSEGYAPFIENLTFEGKDIFKSISLTPATKKTFVRPDLTSNGVLNGDLFACDAETSSTSYPAWKAMDGSTSTYWQPPSLNEGNVSPTPKFTEYIIYSPNLVLLNSITLSFYASSYMPNDIEVYTSIDGESWELNSELHNNSATSTTIQMSKNFAYKYIKIRANQKYYYNNLRVTEITFDGFEWEVEETFLLTVNTVPTDAKVLTRLGSTDKIQEVKYMGSISFKVFKAGYETQEILANVMNEAKEVTVILQPVTPETGIKWFAWTTTSGDDVFTQTDTPKAVSDWTFSSPNNINHVISETLENSLVCNNTTYYRNETNDVVFPLLSQYMTVSALENTPVEFSIQEGTPYLISIDWGDGISEEYVGSSSIAHNYSIPGSYQVKMTSELGEIPTVLRPSASGRLRIKSIDSSLLPMYSNLYTPLTSLYSLYSSGKKFLTLEDSTLEKVCSNLTEFMDLDNYSHLFKGCTSLETALDLGMSSSSEVSSFRYYYLYDSCNKVNIGDLDLSNVQAVDYNSFNHAFCDCPNVTSLDLSGLKEIKGSDAFYNAFYRTNLTSINLSSLEEINQWMVFSGAFSYCSKLTSVDFSSLKRMSSAVQAFSSTFSNCTSLVSADFSNLQTTGNNQAFMNVFNGCSKLETVDFSSLQSVGSLDFSWAFSGCKSLTSIIFDSLQTISDNAFPNAFSTCTNLKDIYFPSLTPTSFGSSTNQFNNMLPGVTGCTVHFPAIIKHTIEKWPDVVAGFGGISTIIRYDIGGCETTFSTTPSENNDYYVDGLPSGPITYLVKGDVVAYSIYNPDYGVFLGSSLVPEATTFEIVNDLNSKDYKTILFQTNVEGAECTFTINRIKYEAEELTSGNYSIRIASDLEVPTDIEYMIKKKGYKGASGVLEFNKENITEDIILEESSTNIDITLEPGLTPYGWQPTTIQNPTEWSMWESTNKGVDSSYAVMKVTFEGYSEFTCYINSYAESGFDYTIVSNLDATSYPTSTSSSIKAHTQNKQYPPTVFNTTNWTTVTFDNLDGDEHYFYVVYRKDGSASTSNDRGYLIIDENQE